MALSLMNGLSSLGAGTAAFAGTAGLEQQRADLYQKQTILADQLATTRESAGRQEAGAIAAAAQEKQQGFLAGQGDLNRASEEKRTQISASASLGAASISAAASKYATEMHSKDVYATIAAAAPEQQARILEQQQKTAFEAVQTQNASDLRNAHTALEAETAKPAPDPTKIASLKSQVVSLETSASTEAATTAAAAAMYRTDMDSVQHFNTQLVTATAQLNNPEMNDTDRAAQKGLIADLKTQLAGAQRALKTSSDLVHGRVGAASGTPPSAAPATGDRPSLDDILKTQGASFNNNAGPRATKPGFIGQPSRSGPDATAPTSSPAVTSPSYSASGPSNTPPALLQPLTATGAAFARQQLAVMNQIDAGGDVASSVDVLGYAQRTPAQRAELRAKLEKTIAEARAGER